MLMRYLIENKCEVTIRFNEVAIFSCGLNEKKNIRNNTRDGEKNLYLPAIVFPFSFYSLTPNSIICLGNFFSFQIFFSFPLLRL